MEFIRAKNDLQCIFQKKHLPLPIYTSVREGGEDHLPTWRCIVKLHNGEEYISDVYNKKTQAELCAASKALKSVNLSNVIRNKTFDNGVSIDKFTVDLQIETPLSKILPRNNILDPKLYPTIILVDVENMPKFIPSIQDKISKYSVRAFVGEHHCLANKLYESGVKVILSPSTRTDGTDTCIQTYVGFLLAAGEFEQYLIATRDHFGSALVDMITAEGMPWKPKHAKVITNSSYLL